jgi:hypothetical protein
LDFPTFGDAEGNSVLAAACANTIKQTWTLWSCADRDPLLKQIYFSLPFLVSSDPVFISYFTLLLKIVFFYCFVFLSIYLYKTIQGASDTIATSGLEIAIIIVAGSILTVNNIPVRLADLEAATFGMAAIILAVRIVETAHRDGRISPTDVLMFTVAANVAGLLKLSFFVHQAVFIVAIAASIPRRVTADALHSPKVWGAFLAGNLGFALQLLYVWHTFDTVGLTEPATAAAVAAARKYPVVGAEFYTIPGHGGYLTAVPGGTPVYLWFAAKLFDALTRVQLAVYGGNVAPGLVGGPSGMIVSMGLADVVKLVITDSLFLLLLGFSVAKGTAQLRVVALCGCLPFFTQTILQHVEPRYFILFRAILVLLILHWATLAVNRLQGRRSFYVTAR